MSISHAAGTTLPPVTDPFADNDEAAIIDDVITDDIPDEPPTVEIPTTPGGKLTKEQMAWKTPDAPWGRKADGTPRKRPGARPGQFVGANAGRTPRAPGPRKTAASSRARQTTGTDYRPGIIGLIQIPAAILGGLGMKDETFALDGAALVMHSPGIAEALNDIAQDNLAVAAALDKILAVGPYGAIIGALLPLVAQIAANHKALPDQVLAGMGAQSRDDFKARLIAENG